MCLAVPAKVLEISDNRAKLDYGGVIREANVSLVDPKIGDYVIVHAGYAIQILDPEEAAETLKVWNEYFDFLDTVGVNEGKGCEPGAGEEDGPGAGENERQKSETVSEK